MKHTKSKFGAQIPAGYPRLSDPIATSLGMPYSAQLKRYLKTPTSLLSYNFPKNVQYSERALSAGNSLPPFTNVAKFGRYFH